MKLTMLFETMMKDYKVMLLHKPTRLYAWVKWYPKEEKWKIVFDGKTIEWKIVFDGKTIELKDLKTIPSDFEIAGAGGTSSTGGEKTPYPKNIVVK